MSSDNSKLHCFPTAVGRDSGVTRMYIFCIISGPFVNFKMSFLKYVSFRLNIFFQFALNLAGTVHVLHIFAHYMIQYRSQWPGSLRRRSLAARLLRLWVRIPPEAWMFVCCECCVLSGRDLCDGLITRPGESYRLWRVVVCDQETQKTRSLKPATGL